MTNLDVAMQAPKEDATRVESVSGVLKTSPAATGDADGAGDSDTAELGAPLVDEAKRERGRRARNRRKRRKKKSGGKAAAAESSPAVDLVAPDPPETITPEQPINDNPNPIINAKDNVMQKNVIEPITEAHEAYVINPPPAPKAEIRVLQGGVGRGALLGSRFAYADFNAASERAIIKPVLVDPVPGRALAFKRELEALGVSADTVEGRVEDIATLDGGNAPVVLNIDRASGIARALRKLKGSGQPVLAYLLVVTPNGQLWGVRLVLEPTDEQAWEVAIRFFEELANVSERNASGAIVGPGADPAHAAIEPAIRRWFATHTTANFQKIVAGVEPVNNSFEVTTDGEETRQLFIAVRDQFGDPMELSWATTANPTNPLRRGTRFVVAEVAPGSIRLHQVRRRLDGGVSLGGVDVLDPEQYEARRRELERQAAAALARAERQTLSRTNPILTTD